MVVYIDTCLFVALVFEDDQHHKRAGELIRELSRGDHGRPLYTSDMVFAESASFVHKKIAGTDKDSRASSKVLQLYSLIEQNRLEMLYLQGSSFGEALDLYTQHQGKLDFVDSANVILMRSRGIHKIASFDTNYDAFAKEGIGRIH